MPFELMGDTPQLPAKPPGKYFPLRYENQRDCPTFTQGKPIIGTTYFYWYDIDTKSHIVNYDGSDALTTHPADMENISYKRSSWHEQQLRDMIAADIDFLMPVFWGVPGKYEGWSFQGLGPLVAAHDALIKRAMLISDKLPPQIGLFYDTSILQHNRFNQDGSSLHVDLATPFGRKWFYTALRDFFSLIPPTKWARVEGKPIVFLYGPNFAKRQDPALMDYVRKCFHRDFSVEPFIVKHHGWLGKADAEYRWGGALSLSIDSQVAALGPGYDHSAVPGREPLVIDRRGGETYQQHWKRLLATQPDRRPWMVHIETWNEWHEGTDIAHSREYGRSYINLTRKYADLWHKEKHIPFEGAFTKAKKVCWQPDNPSGLDLRKIGGDGNWEIAGINDVPAVIARPNPISNARFIYFSIDDTFIYDNDLTVEVSVTYHDSGCHAFTIHYDNADSSKGPVGGAFRSSDTVIITGTEKWKTAILKLPRCRFTNRCNAADFRLAPEGGNLDLAVREIVVRKVKNH